MAEQTKEQRAISAAEAVKNGKEGILERWEDAVRKEIPAAKHHNKMLIRNHIVPYMDDIVEALKKVSVTSVLPQQAGQRAFKKETTDIHGRLRATLPGYTIGQVIREYAILRHVVIDVLKSHEALDSDILEVVSLVNEKAILHAATEFSDSVSSLREKAVSTLMHDMRTPLQVVTMTSDILRNQEMELNKGLDIISENTNKLDKMIRELLNAVRLDAGEGLEFKFEEWDLRELVLDCLETSEITYPGRVAQDLIDEPVCGSYDATGIVRSIENLISNAIKYGDQDKMVTVGLKAENGKAIISVHNWGQPIPEEENESIFFAFGRSPTVEKKQYEGWGLGLAYVKAVAEGHGGQISMDSSEKEGTVFRVILSYDDSKNE